jgi:hypothetical protein
MPNVLQILSKNYSGESVNITFTPLKGSPQKFENVSLPYNFINDTFEGNYTLFFPDYNLTHKFTYPDVSPISRCFCTEFSCFSFIGSPCKVSYTTCRGETRNVSMISGQSHKDCVKEKNYKTSKGVTTTTYNYCTVLSDCIELSQPPTPQPTRTPTRTPASTTTPTSTPTVTKTSTPTNTITKTPTNTLTPTKTSTKTPTPTNTNTPTNTITQSITPSITPSNTPTKTPLPSFGITLNPTPTQTSTPSVTQTITPTITQTITPTSLCRCVTITNLLSSANTITYQFCGYVEIGPVLIEYELEPNEVLRDCMINESVIGDNILVSYDGGTCIQVGNQRICPELPISPTPTMTPTITQTVTPSSPINQNIIIASGRKIFPDNTSQQGLFKYDYDLNTMTYLNISGLYAGVSHTYNFQTQTGKIWASNGDVVQEYNILNSNLDNELNRTIILTGTGYGRNLTFKNDNTLIKTILVNGERWVAEIDITETNVNPITTLKFRITSTDSNDDTFTTDLMYTNTGKFIWTNRFPNVVLQQYDYETGALEFESPVSLQPASLFQINSQIVSIQTAPVRVVYDLVTADDTLICPNILCGPTTGPTTLPGCIGQNCNLYNFESNGVSSLLINNTVNFVPNQVCPIVDDFVVSQDFGTILVQNNTEYDLNVFTKNSTTLIGTVLSGQLGQFPETSFEESTVGVVPTYLEYFSTCRVCRDFNNYTVDCETGCGILSGLQMSKINNGLTLSVLNTSPFYLLFYDSVGSNQQLFEVGAYNGSMNYPTMFFIYNIIVIVNLKDDGTVCNTCFSLDTLLEIPCS